MKKLIKFIKKHKVVLIVWIFILLLIISIPSAYFLGKNSIVSYGTSFPDKQFTKKSYPLSSDPFERMEQLNRRMDNIFNEVWHDPFFSYSYKYPSIMDMDFLPSINFDVKMSDDKIIIKADLPIEDESHANVTITDEGVSIKSSKQKHTKETTDNMYKESKQSQQFYRYLALPENVDTSNVIQTFEDGELEIIIPLQEGEMN